VARIIKPGVLQSAVFRGRCPACRAVIEAERTEVMVEQCPREHYEFAHFNCLQCKAGMVMYPGRGGSDHG